MVGWLWGGNSQLTLVGSAMKITGNRMGKLCLTCNEHGYGWVTAIDVFDTCPRIFNSDALGHNMIL